MIDAALSWFIIGLGSVTLFDYVVGHPEWTAWTRVAPMASPTGLALVAIGIRLLRK